MYFSIYTHVQHFQDIDNLLLKTFLGKAPDKITLLPISIVIRPNADVVDVP